MKPLSISAAWPGKDAESLVWLASFPRSGNTFARILLANYFASGDAPYDINKLLDFVPADTTGKLWANFLGEISGPNTFESTWQARPEFFRYYRKALAYASFPGLKTHTANLEFSGRRGFEFRKSDRAIYIVRHPLDVLLSYADYNGRDIESAIEVMTTSGLMVFDHTHAGSYELRGSWVEHVASWIADRPCPLLLIRYEELRSATEQVLRDILDFLGAPIIPARVKRAAEASRFDRVREQDSRNKFVETPSTVRSGSFFRKAQALQWLRDMTPDQAYRLGDACDPLMSRLGYTHPRDVYFDGRNALQPINLSA